jgi:hypothetical protein
MSGEGAVGLEKSGFDTAPIKVRPQAQNNNRSLRSSNCPSSDPYKTVAAPPTAPPVNREVTTTAGGAVTRLVAGRTAEGSTLETPEGDTYDSIRCEFCC